MNYQVGDFVIRIKNAAMARRKEAVLSHSRMNKALADVLTKEHFLESSKEEVRDGKKVLVAKLAYENRKPVFTNVTLVSKPSLRVYKSSKDTKEEERRKSVVSVFSTSKGIMTGQLARKQQVGGELLFMIW